MTDAWGALAVAVALTGQGTQATVEPIDNVLVVEWRHKQIRPADGAVIFSGGVVAHYGVTTLTAEKLTLYQAEKHKEGMAEGNVHIQDPDGDVTAESLRFDWLNQTGNGSHVKVAIEGLWLNAEILEITPGEWRLRNVVAAPDNSRHPLFAVRSPDVSYRQGRGGTARRLGVTVAGARLITLPSYRFGARRLTDGLRLPSVSYNQGFGIAWQSSYLFDDRSRLSGGFRAKRGNRPGAQVELTRSLLPRNEPGTLSPPESDLTERFSYGYLDSVYVRRPSEEQDAVGFRRSSVTLGATANQSPVGRLSQSLVTKPFDLIFEEGRQFKDVGLFANLRYQSLSEDDGVSEKRAILSGAALARPVQLGKGLTTQLRVNYSGFTGDNSFAWGQVQVGLLYNPTSWLRMGAAYVYGSQTGTPTFELDRLFASKAFHGRMDLDFGSTRLSFLSKFDFDRKKWYDNELGLSQVMGPIEPFVIFREFPRTITFGVRLTAERAFDRLRRRLEGHTPNETVDRP